MKKSYLLRLVAMTLFIAGMTGYINPAISQGTLLHFWYFGEQVPNNTPLTTLDANYSITGTGAGIDFQSALAGYPFTEDHLSWRKASMERRNSPTPINYRPAGNTGLQYVEGDMRGIQIKQPFSGDGGQNTLVFNVPTTDFQDIVLSFAAINEAAAEALLIDYSVDATTPTWINTGLTATSLPLSDIYTLYTVSFSEVAAADNNASFKIRIRFQAADMTADLGGRVTFNNFSIDGSPLDGVNLPPVVTNPITLQNTIEVTNDLNWDMKLLFSDPDNSTLTYSATSDRPTFVRATVNGSKLTVSPLKRGDATITVSANDGINTPVSFTFRVLVYPGAFKITEANFLFDSWNSNQPELTYPASMLFLQSNDSDPGLNNNLEFAYYIPHEDYHPDDAATIGFPYNNTSRSRINGLGSEGISFINTGRDRDLGGALVAINTTGVTALSVNFTAATLIRNIRLYALRLQYRIGTSGDFIDVLQNGMPVEYMAATDGDAVDFTNISLPSALLGKEYVQLLWRYYHPGTETGTRSMLRLDNISFSLSTNNEVVDAQPLRIFSYNNRIFIENSNDGNLLVDVYNITGQKVFSQKSIGAGQLTLDSEFTPGIYIVTLQSAIGKLSKKIIVR